MVGCLENVYGQKMRRELQCRPQWLFDYT